VPVLFYDLLLHTRSGSPDKLLLLTFSLVWVRLISLSVCPLYVPLLVFFLFFFCAVASYTINSVDDGLIFSLTASTSWSISVLRFAFLQSVLFLGSSMVICPDPWCFPLSLFSRFVSASGLPATLVFGYSSFFRGSRIFRPIFFNKQLHVLPSGLPFSFSYPLAIAFSLPSRVLSLRRFVQFRFARFFEYPTSSFPGIPRTFFCFLSPS